MYIIAWLVIGICSYFLFIQHLEKFTKRIGGLEGLYDLCVKKDKSLSLVPSRLAIALGKTALLVLCCLTWPYVLLSVVKGHISPEKTQNKVNKKLEEWVNS